MRNSLHFNCKALTITFALLFITQNLFAASAKEIDLSIDAALERFYKELPGSQAFTKKAKAVLVFPSVIKAGIGLGAEYGEGAMRIGGKTVDYYNTMAASIGFQLGAASQEYCDVIYGKCGIKRV
jgi:lipid-binding SYLF domain-containing protein